MQVVLFSESNARVITNPTEDFSKNPRAIVDPDLTQVHGVPPHFWKFEFGRVLPMDNDEKAERLKVLEGGSNITSVNDLLLRLSNLQVSLEAKDEEIMHLTTEHNENMSATYSKFLSEEQKTKHEHQAEVFEVKRVAKLYYYIIMVSSLLTGGVISWMVLK